MRRASDVSRHSGNAAFAAATAVPTSSAEANGTRAVTAPVAGSVTSPNVPLVPADVPSADPVGELGVPPSVDSRTALWSVLVIPRSVPPAAASCTSVRSVESVDAAVADVSGQR